MLNIANEISEKRVLVAPLNWGLGHATRCVPIINALLAAEKEVIIAADGYPLLFLKKQFPNLQTIDFKGINIKYCSSNSQILAMILQMPKIFFSIFKEHYELKKIIQQYDIQAVISDNRFGLWNKKIKTIYITHQISVKISKRFEFLNKIAYHLHYQIINKYSQCFIPDFEGENNLSGDLSHKYTLPKNAQFIGILSRFSQKILIDLNKKNNENNYKNVAIISGVEPHRTILQKKLLNLFLSKNEKSLIIEGKPAQNIDIQNINNVTIVSHLEDEELAQTLKNAEKIYCRSGYSTLMDLWALGIKSAILIPTPGQTEQEYLAEHFLKKGFSVLKQEDLD